MKTMVVTHPSQDLVSCTARFRTAIEAQKSLSRREVGVSEVDRGGDQDQSTSVLAKFAAAAFSLSSHGFQ